MAESQVMLSTEERQYLVALLQSILKDKLVEEHRTRTPLYRDTIVHQEDMINDLLRKLGQPVSK